MKAVPYLRVSTDDKGQNPERQHDLIKLWGTRENIEILPPIIDEGTSADTSAFDRKMFLEAIEEARGKGADAIVIETTDRLTRRGVEDYWVSIWRMKKEHRLKIWQADQSIEHQETFAGQLVNTINAAMAQQWLARHKKAVKSGMDRQRAAGSKFGRKPKQFTDEEIEIIRREMAKPVYRNKKQTLPNLDRKGWKGIAHEINTMRGCFEIADPAFRAKKLISESTVKRVAHQLGLVAKVEGQKSKPVKMEENHNV